MENTWDSFNLFEVRREVGLGGLVSSFELLLKEKLEYVTWLRFFDELDEFRARLEPFCEVSVPIIEAVPEFSDHRHFASHALKVLRAASQVSRHFRQQSVDSPRLASLLNEIEAWAGANVPTFERAVWSSAPKANDVDGMKADELALLMSRLSKLNRMLKDIAHEDFVGFCDKNQRFITALSSYTDETRSSAIELDVTTFVTLAKSVEPRIRVIRDQAYELSNTFDSVHVVHILLLELERHMIDSLVRFKRLMWLRPSVAGETLVN